MISVVIPCYNESEVLQLTCSAVREAAKSWKDSYELLLVDDGSEDDTWKIIEREASQHSNFRGIKLSRNFGHQAAIGAGFEKASGSAVVVLDADLQDPPELIGEMIQKWRDGFDVVYARRSARQGESVFKKVACHVFYRVLGKINSISIPSDTGDFALMDIRVVEEMLKSAEHAMFWRGLRCWVGFRHTCVEYDRPGRVSGESKYTLAMLMQLALNGLFSFSSFPLRLPAYLGAAMLVASIAATFGLSIGAVIGLDLPWWSLAILLAVFWLGSIQMICIGILGEFLDRVYNEVRGRTRWIIESSTESEAVEKSNDKRAA